MKEILLKSMLGVVFLVLASASVQAAPVLFSWGGEEIVKVADFPNTDEFEYSRGEYVDAGYVYKQVTIFFIPVWNYDGRWVGYVGKGKSYLELNKTQLDQLAQMANVKLPASPTLPFWHAIGGKIVFSLILLLYIGWKFLSSSAIGEEEPASEGTSTLGLN